MNVDIEAEGSCEDGECEGSADVNADAEGSASGCTVGATAGAAGRGLAGLGAALALALGGVVVRRRSRRG